MRELYGTTACAGLALGPAKVLLRRYSPLERIVQETLRETSLFEAAVVVAKDEISKLVERASDQDKAIFTFQIEVLSDRGLLDEILGYIATGTGAAAAVERAAGIYAAKIRSIPDEYLAQRAGDIQDALPAGWWIFWTDGPGSVWFSPSPASCSQTSCCPAI